MYQVDLKQLDFNRKQTLAKVVFGALQQIYYFEKPKDLLLGEDGFDMKTKLGVHGIEISLKATTLQKNVFLYTDVPGHVTDNLFELLPGQEKNITLVTSSPQNIILHHKTLNALQNESNPFK